MGGGLEGSLGAQAPGLPGLGRLRGKVEVRAAPVTWASPKLQLQKEDSWRGPPHFPPQSSPTPKLAFLIVALLLPSLFFLSLLLRAPRPDPVNICPAPPQHTLPWVVAIYRNRYVLGDSQAVLLGKSIPPRASQARLQPAGSPTNCPPACVSMFYECYRFEHSRNCN